MNADQQTDLDIAPATIKELINETIDSVICAELLGDDEVDLALSEELEIKLLGSVDEKEEEDEWESCEERENGKMEQEDKGEHGIGKAGAQANNAGQEEMEKDEIGSVDESVVLEEHGATAQIEIYENEAKGESETKGKIINRDKSEMVSEGFANAGFDDIREALEVLEGPRHNDGEFERPLLPGDRVWVEEYEYISGKEYLDKERWIYAGLIQSQARATKVERVHLARQKDQEGLVVDLSRRGRAAEGSTGAVVVAAYGMVRAMALYERQLHPGIRMTDLKKAQPLKIQLADIPESWFVGPNYVLPNNTPVRTGMELQAGPNTKIPATAGQFARNWPRKNAAGLPIIFPFMPEYTQEEVAVSERIIAGALVVAAEHEETLKLVTQFKGAVEPQWDCWAPGGPLETPKYFWLKFQTSDRKHLKQLTEQWATDSPLSAKPDYDTEAFAQGQVILVNKSSELQPDGTSRLLVDVKVQLTPHTGSDDQRRRFRQMVDGEEVIVQSAGAAVGFADQAECFGTNGPSSIMMKEESPRAEIVKALLGRPGSSGINVPVSERIKTGLGQQIYRDSVSRLNDEQKQTLALVACSHPLAILQQAPPGTGKTLTLATAIDLLTSSERTETVIVATATSNLPVTKMVEETRSVGVEEECLALFSGTARVRYGEQIRVLEDALLTHKLTDEFLATIKEKAEVMDYEQYKKQVEKNPLRAAEARMADRFLDRESKKVMFMTTHMARRIPAVTERMTHLLLDEATQTSFTTILCLVCQAPCLEKLLATGDVRQLGVHLRELNEVLWTGFGLESVTDQLVKCPRVEETALKKCYRSHESLVQCVSYASYESHGEEVLAVPEITERRTALTTAAINLPVAEIPLVLIHSEGRIQMEETSFSLSNEGHNRIARTLVNTLDSALANDLKIVIICLYLYERDVMAKALKEDKEKGRIGRAVEVHTVDSYQAKEADVVVLITTRTKAATAGQTRTAATATDFFRDDRRATVALSRAKEGMIVIADFRTLLEGKVWKRFVEKAGEMVPIVSEEYLQIMDSPNVRRVQGILTNQNGYSPTVSLNALRGQGDSRNAPGGPIRSRETADKRRVDTLTERRNDRRDDRPRPSLFKIPQGSSRDCFKCGKPGHFARNCRSN